MKAELRIAFITAVILVLLYLSACGNSVECPTSINETSTVSPTATRTPTPTPTRHPTSAPRPTKTITPTIGPIINADLDSWLKERFSEPDCDLPCFWGITPGDTTVSEAIQILKPMSTWVDWAEHFTVSSHQAFNFSYDIYTSPKLDESIGYLIGYHDQTIYEIHSYLDRLPELFDLKSH